MTVLDEIDGISGRPLSGLLGTIFKLIGEGDAVFSRFSISTDGLQIVRAKAKKLVSRTVTATIGPDGKAQNGCPMGGRTSRRSRAVFSNRWSTSTSHIDAPSGPNPSGIFCSTALPLRSRRSHARLCVHFRDKRFEATDRGSLLEGVSVRLPILGHRVGRDRHGGMHAFADFHTPVRQGTVVDIIGE